MHIVFERKINQLGKEFSTDISVFLFLQEEEKVFWTIEKLEEFKKFFKKDKHINSFKLKRQYFYHY